MCFTSTSTNNTTSSPPPQILSDYQNLIGQATGVGANLQGLPAQQVAPLTPEQQTGISTINGAVNAGMPYYQYGTQVLGNAASGTYDAYSYLPSEISGISSAQSMIPGASSLVGSGASTIGSALPYYSSGAGLDLSSTVNPITSGQISSYLNPYTQDVVNATQAAFNNENAQQANQLTGAAIMGGNAFGGDRAGVAQAALAGQQQTAEAPVIAGLESQGYTSAVQEAQAEQQLQQSAAGIMGQLGSGVTGAGSALGNLGSIYGGLAGTAGNLASLYGNAASTQAGIGSAEAGIGTQIASLGPTLANELLGQGSQQFAAGTTGQQTEQAYLNAKYQALLNQLGVTGTAFQAPIVEGTGSLTGGTSSAAGTQSPSIFSVLSDRRAKENIKKIGKLFDGQSVYRFNYKGDRTTRIGLMAQNVEKEKPEAIHEISGLKTVDYDKATKDAARKKHFARGGLAYDDGGSVSDEMGNSLIGYDALNSDLIGGEKADTTAASLLHLANGGIASPSGLDITVSSGQPGFASIPHVQSITGRGPPSPGQLSFPQQQTILGNIARIGETSKGLSNIGSGASSLWNMIGPSNGGDSAMGGWSMDMPGSGVGTTSSARGGRIGFASGGSPGLDNLSSAPILSNAGLDVNVFGGPPGPPSIPDVQGPTGLNNSGPPQPGQLPSPQQNSILGNIAKIGGLSSGLSTIGSGLSGLGSALGIGGGLTDVGGGAAAEAGDLLAFANRGGRISEGGRIDPSSELQGFALGGPPMLTGNMNPGQMPVARPPTMQQPAPSVMPRSAGNPQQFMQTYNQLLGQRPNMPMTPNFNMGGLGGRGFADGGDADLADISGTDSGSIDLAPDTSGQAGLAAIQNAVHDAPQDNTLARLQNATYGQESSYGHNTSTSSTGAIGPMQIEPPTWRQYAHPGESINDPVDNRNVGNRILADYYNRYGDPARAAVAYFSGPGNVAPPGSSTPWKRNVADPSGKTVSSYVGDILGKMNSQSGDQALAFDGTPAPSGGLTAPPSTSSSSPTPSAGLASANWKPDITQAILAGIGGMFSGHGLIGGALLGGIGNIGQQQAQHVQAVSSDLAAKRLSDEMDFHKAQIKNFESEDALRKAQIASAGRTASEPFVAGERMTIYGPQKIYAVRGPNGQLLDATSGKPIQETTVPGQLGASPTGTPATSDLHGDEYLKTVDPQMASQVKALAEGRMQFPSGFALKTPYWQNMLSMVAQYDPSFDAVQYNARSRARTDATSGKMAQTNNALNTGIGHLSQLADAVADLHNVSWSQSVNGIKNWLSTEFGGTGQTNFDAIKNRVAPEIVKIWRGTGGAESDIKRDIDSLSASKTPAQLYGAISNIAGLMESKIAANRAQYDQAMGTHGLPLQMITPQAQQTLDKLRGLANGEPVQSNGPIKVQTKAEADKLAPGTRYVTPDGQVFVR